MSANSYGLDLGRHVLVKVLVDPDIGIREKPAIVVEAGSEMCTVEVFGLKHDHPERLHTVRVLPGYGEWRPL